MTDPLIQTLLSERLVSRAVIEEAVQRQVVVGGSLDTNLLEVGAVDEASMLRVLGIAHNLPTAGRGEIDAIAAHLPQLFPLPFAETYRLVPYQLVGQNLGVLVSGAPDATILDAVRERLHLFLAPAITTEVRQHYAMHRLYGTTLLPRVQTLLLKLDGALPTSLAPDGQAPRAPVLSWGLSLSQITPIAGRGGGAHQVASVPLRKLEYATDRDTVIEILLQITLGTFEFGAFFLIHGDRINGWRSVDAESTSRVARISMPVELPSGLQTIYATNGHYLGPLPSNTANARLLTDLGRTPPRVALLAPIIVAGKLAAILYADNGRRAVAPKRVGLILLAATRAGAALERIVRQRKAATSLPPLRPDTGTGDQPLEISDRPPSSNEAPPAVLGVAEASTPELATASPAATASVQGEPPAAQPLYESAPRSFEAVAGRPARPGQYVATDSLTSSDFWQSVTLEEAAPRAYPNPFSGGAIPPVASAQAEEDDMEMASDDDVSYVAFEDIDETPEKAVGEWQDVLVEALSGGGAAEAEAFLAQGARARVAVSWDDVIAEAAAAPALTSVTTSTQIEVAGKRLGEWEIWLDTLEARDAETRNDAIAKLQRYGNSLDEVLRERFPGKIEFDPFGPNVKLPAFEKASGLTGLLAARGPASAPAVLPHLESDDRVKRLFAIYYLLAVPYPQAIEALSRRLYDSEPRNRYLAVEGLRRYQNEPAYRRVLQGLRDQLKVPVYETQVATVQILGQLRDPSAVPALIPLVVSPQHVLATAAASTLAVICAQAFGADVAQWAEWWQIHYSRPRETWLLEGLRHSDPSIVRIAHAELLRLTGQAGPSASSPTSVVDETTVRAWESWWQTHSGAANPS
jgi:hypothetical protein